MFLRRLCSQITSKTQVNLKKHLFSTESYYRPRASIKTQVVLYLPRPCRRTEYKLLNSNIQNLLKKERPIHTSSTNRALPPIVWLVLRSVLKFGAVVTGRGIRKWWARLPESKRLYILQEINKNRNKFFLGAAICSGMVYVYYISHIVEDPITKRKRFLIFSEKQIMQMAMVECEVLLENYKEQVVKSGYQYNRVLQIAQKILQANNNLPGIKKDWQVIIIDEVETTNAFVLPSGHIFIFTGMLVIVDNDDQLSAILAHEMAHALLCHSAEAASKMHLLEMLLILPIAAIWTMFPDIVALTSHYFTEYISAVLFQLPFSRKLETEADTIGLEMIARSCYDPRQASVFWRKMEKLAEDEEIEWLSTHPSHKTRYSTLDELMPKALRILTKHCRKSDLDPRGRE